MQVAYSVARQSLPKYSSKFSRKDFTLPQLFACLVLKEHQKRSYRQAEALLADSPEWLHAIGLKRAPDHNTLQRAASLLLRQGRVDRLMDCIVRWAAQARILGLSKQPLAIDSTTYESHHVSRHYEQRCHETRKRMRAKELAKTGRNSTRSDTVKRLPKLGIAAATDCHLVLALWTGTGMGSDHPHFRPLLEDVRRRVPHRRLKVACDAGYDSEANHRWAREEMGLITLIPPEHGRPRKDGGPPGGRWRRHMKRVLATRESRRRSGYTSRWQDETINSMMKRNLSSALRGKTPASRERDMALKVITHDVMILKLRVETEQVSNCLPPPPFCPARDSGESARLRG